MPEFTTLPPLSLYIHFPWCVEKCPYCDFNSHTLKTPLPTEEYIDCLLLDLENELPSIWGRSIQTIFMGGGTPSLFTAEAIDKLLQGLRARLNFSLNIEITLEANPGTIDQSQFIGFRQAGVNRLSMGIQSFEDNMLNKLGRIHDSSQAFSAVEAARNANFKNFNLDLMFGLPEQTIEQMIKDLQTAIALNPSHLSHYQLTLEPNTLFARHPPRLPDDDDLWEMTLQSHQLLKDANYQQYEISAFSKQETSNTTSQCKHNLNYWQFGDYLGIGAGAHQKLSFANTQSIERRIKQKHPAQYMSQVKNNEHVIEQHSLEDKDILFEFMLNALRLTNGFELKLIPDNAGLNSEITRAQLDEAQQNNWVIIKDDKIIPTATGQQYLNDLVSLFLPE